MNIGPDYYRGLLTWIMIGANTAIRGLTYNLCLMDSDSTELNNSEITRRLDALELRIAQLESVQKMVPAKPLENDEPELFDQFKGLSVGSLLESKVGEYGLSWLGNIVLFFGIIFLVEFLVATLAVIMKSFGMIR